jgi:2-dehydropantoate 2-reductase
MKMLIVGAGVIGTVYGAHMAAAGSKVSVLSHGPRASEVAAGGLSAHDVLGGGRVDAEVDVVSDTGGNYDVVLVSVRRDQLASACAGLTVLAGKPAVVFFGNNPAGRVAIPDDVPGEVYLGFPGVGGVMSRGIADYVRIRQQPTALPEASDPRLAALESALSGRGFAVQRVTDMDGWLAYHAAFVACVAAALYRCGTDPVRLAADRATLTLMCQAITGAFAALRTDGTAGLPRNLAVLHSPLLKAVAVPLLGSDHAVADGRAVFRRALAARRGGDAGPRPGRGRSDHQLPRPDRVAPPRSRTSYDTPTVALRRTTGSTAGSSP